MIKPADISLGDMIFSFKHSCVILTPSKTFSVRVNDKGCTKCLGTYKTEKEAVEVANNFRLKRLARTCLENFHRIEDGVIVEDHYLLFDNGDIFVIDTAIKLKPFLNGAGYLSVVLNGKTRRVHRLVAESFIPRIPNKNYVNHKDGNKLNNDAANLEWCTQSENIKHAFATGLMNPANLKGEDCPWSKLTEKDVKYIREHYIPRDQIYGGSALGRKFNISQQMVSRIILNQRWVEEDDEMNEKTTYDKKSSDFLYDYQLNAVNKMKNGCILCGNVGSGKSRTALFYYFKENGGWISKDEYIPMKNPQDLIIISTAKKRDSLEWLGELANFLLYPDKDGSTKFGNRIVVDSWNNIGKYKDLVGAFFILDEQRLVSYGSWTKSFLKIAKNNNWILLSATPADHYGDYLPVFLGNGFYRNKTEFNREHVIYSRFTKYPKIDRYVNTRRLDRLIDRILVTMDYTHDIQKENEDVYCSYDTSLYRDVMRKRWDPFKDSPIQDAGGLCYVLRRVVNTDQSRQVKLLEILENHPRAIIFYNFNYERDILLSLGYEEGTEIAEWNGHKHQPVPTSDKWIYICQYTSACEGWECITTNCVIFYSQNYSYKVVTQAAGRIDRLNTKYDVLYYYHLKTRSGIDLAISRALKEKKQFNERKFTKWDREEWFRDRFSSA